MSNNAKVEGHLAHSRIVVFVILSTAVLILFTASTFHGVAGPLPEGLPSWFKDLDNDKDGQISLAEWLKSGKKFDEFRKYDLNNDGLITPEEILRVLRKPIPLKLAKGQTDYESTIETTDVKYQEKKLAKVFTIKLEFGKTYQFDLKSKAFDAYLYLEGVDGSILAQDDDGGGGTNVRIVYQATGVGTHRLIATSVSGKGRGPFSFSISVVKRVTRKAPEGLPSWFEDLDKNKDGQISLAEWLKSGKKRDEFSKYDLNDDGLITPEEILRVLKKPIPLKPAQGQADYEGTIETTDVKYKEKKLAKIFTLNLVAGKTYQFDHRSQAFDAYLYLENSDGTILAQDDDGGGGTNARIVHRATESGTYRLIATSLGGKGLGDFSFSMRVLTGGDGTIPKGLPSWFADLDKNQDGQISLAEWREGGKELAEFRQYDLNDDGLITAEEVLRLAKTVTRLEFENGQADYEGAIEEPTDAKYRSKKAFKIFTIKLEKGKTYQFEHVSEIFYAYLYLEDPDHEIVDKHNSGGRGKTASIVHHAAKTGIYRIIATSQDGYKAGDFSLSIWVLSGFGGTLPKGLPSWFEELDKDQDGQISLAEWREAGKELAEFRQYDLNDDGFITAEEVLQYMKNHAQRPLPKGLPSWFAELDKDQDGQISLAEWREGGKELAEFRRYDLNDDGLITAEEVLQYMKKLSNRPTKGKRLK